MAFLAGIANGAKSLQKVEASATSDRSAVNLANATPDVLEDEAERWKYFFESGLNSWFEDIKEHTFSSTFCSLEPHEARAIVEHWEARERLLAAKAANADDLAAAAAVESLLSATVEQLAPLATRLHEAIQAECAKSPERRAFVKLSTRSPKDSKKALARAATSYRERVVVDDGSATATTTTTTMNDNDKWIALSEEVTRAGAVSSGAEALELLLDSARVFEDLEYALRGPPATTDYDSGAGAAASPSSPSLPSLEWNMSLCARAWDPRLTPESEFRGIAWGGELTCLCQYFHPLYFDALASSVPPEAATPCPSSSSSDVVSVTPSSLEEAAAAPVGGRAALVMRDCQATFNAPAVKAAVARLGGHCIVDFAWLGPGEVIVIELNPFDGVCLGTFPASTGLFLWDDPRDQTVMTGEAPFELRLRTRVLESERLWAQCNSFVYFFQLRLARHLTLTPSEAQ